MIYDSKLNYATEFDNHITSPYITFTGKADISVKDEYCAVSVANDYVARHIVLNNNITVTCNNLDSDIWGVDLEKSNSDKEPTIYSNNAAKTTKVTVKTDFSRSAYGWSSSYYMSLKIGGAVMLHNFNISVTGSAADIYASGIQSQYLKSNVDFRGNFTITSKAEGSATSRGIALQIDFSAKDISGKFKVSATSPNQDAESYGVTCGDFNSEKLSGKFDITAVTKTGDDWYNAYAYAFRTAAFSVKRGFTGSINVKSNAPGSDSYAYAFSATQIKLQGKSTGSISVTAQGGVSAESYGMKADRITLANYSGNISCKAVAGGDSAYPAYAYGIYSQYAITCYGDFSGKLDISSENKNKKDENAYASGIRLYENTVLMDDITGVWNISAKGYNTEAYGIETTGNVTLGNISGNKSVAAKSYSSAAGGVAYGFRGYDVSIGRISDKITVSATGYAYGFFAQNSLRIKDMSKMNLSVTCSDGSACAINVENVENAEYGENEGFILDSPVFNFGKVSAVGKWGTIGLSADTITGYNSSRSRIEGSITATSKAYRATGIILSSVSKDIVFSSTISATGKTEAYGISFGSGNLILDNAKITAKVTGKDYKQNAFVLYTEDSQKNTITITGNSVLTGLISTGKGNDTVYMDSGSKVIGGFNGVTSLYLNINDASQKSNIMWQASGITSQTYTSISVEFGLLGDFKIISKSSDIDWTKLFSNAQFDAMQNNLIKGNELYTYGLYKSGNNLYVKAMLKNALSDDAEVIQEKASGDYSLHKKYTVFTNKADLTVKNSITAVNADLTQHTLVLDNNITVDLKDFSNCAYGVSSSADKFTLVSNNAAKMLKVSGKGSTLSTVAGYNMKSTALKIQGGRFLQNATVSGQNTGVGDLDIYGIIAADLDGTAQGLNCAATDIAGNFTVSGKAYGELAVYGMKTGKFIARDISGKFSITSSCSNDTATTYAIFAKSLTLEKLTGKITVKSSGNADYGDYNRAAALFTDGKEDGKDLVITDGFSGSIEVDVKDKYRTKAFGIATGSDIYYTDSNLILGGRNTGSVKVSAQGDSGAYAYGIFAENSATLTNFSGAITAKATVKGDGAVSAYAICQEENGKSLDFIGTFSSKVTVSAQNKKMDKGTVDAHAVYARSNISADDITGVWNISASGYNAGAYGLSTMNGGSIKAGNISGNKTITAKSSYKDGESYTYAFHSAGTFTANKISDAIKVSATGTACGFYSNKGFLVNDMSKMQLTVTSSNNKAYGIQVYDSVNGNFIVDNDGLNLGKITVNGYSDAYGICVGNNIYTVDDCQNNRLEGTITVKSKSGYAYGIDANKFWDDDGKNAVVCSANISVTGKNGSSAIDIMYGDLTFDNATVTAKVTDKNSVKNSYAVWAIYYDHNISLTGKSKITGNIWTGSGKDKVSIESGSKLVGAMEGVETVELILNDKSQAKQSLWDVTMDSGDAVDLNINFDYGMTGDFLLATKKSGFDWEDVIDLNDCTLYLGENNSLQLYGGCDYGDFNFELKEKGNQLILSVAEKL